MIQVEHLTKRYGPVTAVSDVSFSVEKGQIVGFLGPNGAGKSTTMKILSCFMPASGGSARVAGYDVFSQRVRVPKWKKLAVAARVLPGFSPHQLIRDPAAYALAAAGIVSFMLYATALEGGSVTVATAAVVLAETTPPAVVGVLLLGDHTRPGLGGLAVLGFSLAVVCAVALARFGIMNTSGGRFAADEISPSISRSGETDAWCAPVAVVRRSRDPPSIATR